MKKIYKLIILLILLAVVTTGCYWFREVESSEVGLLLDDGVTISQIVSSGRYGDGGWYAAIRLVDVSNITTEWIDTSLVTKDKQPISLTLALTFARDRNPESIETMFNQYRSEIFDNNALALLVHSRVPSVAKAITTNYTLDQMLGIAEGEDAVGREQVERELEDLLRNELTKIGVILEKAVLADIGVSPSFLQALERKAQVNINQEIARAQTITLQEELKQEKAQTDIAIEIAKRENAVNEVLAQAYKNPELLEIERLKLLADILGEGDLVVYVPAGTDIISVISGGALTPMPVP